MSKAWARGSSRRWRTVRAAVLQRDGYRCKLARGVCTGTATQVHHVHGKGRCRGCGVDDPSHLVSACQPCNLQVGDPGRAEDARARNARASVVTRW